MSASRFFIGQVIQRGIARQDTVKVRCLKMVLDDYIHKYFNKRTHHWALETAVKVDVGDIVLIKNLPEKITARVGHEIEEVVYKLGAVVDPITGRRCRGKHFIDETEREQQRSKIETEYARRKPKS